MEVSFEVFSDIINDVERYNCCNILFLNKTDLFREKILTPKGYAEFEEKFPDFQDYMKHNFQEDIERHCKKIEEVSYENEEDRIYWGGLKYLERKFRECIKDQEDQKQLLVFPTCAIDGEQIMKVFVAVKDYIFDLRFKLSGILF